MNTPNPINLTAIDHVVLRAYDFERLTNFYVDVLGCKLERFVKEFGLVQLRAGASLIDIVDLHGRLGEPDSQPRDQRNRNMDHFCLQVDPWDETAILNYLRTKDIEPGQVETRYGARGSGPSIYLQDPEGNQVELKGSV